MTIREIHSDELNGLLELYTRKLGKADNAVEKNMR